MAAPVRSHPGNQRVSAVCAPDSGRALKSLKKPLKISILHTPNLLRLSALGWRRGSESNEFRGFWPHCSIRLQLPHSQLYRMTGYENAYKIRLKRTRRQARQNSVTTHKIICANSFTGELLALLLALFPSNDKKSEAEVGLRPSTGKFGILVFLGQKSALKNSILLALLLALILLQNRVFTAIRR